MGGKGSLLVDEHFVPSFLIDYPDWLTIVLSCLILDTSPFIQQLCHAEFRMPHPMANLVSVEQTTDRLPPIVVIQATSWWETALAHVKLEECGLGVNLPVKVCCFPCVICLKRNLDVMRQK